MIGANEDARLAVGSSPAVARRFTPVELAMLVPHPAEDAHKYSRGKLVVVGGSAAYPGAVCLAAMAGQRMGAGYVEVRCAGESVLLARMARPSLVVRSWDGLSAGDLPATRANKPVACVVGPGVDASDDQSRAAALAAIGVRAALLVDGGALSVLASEEGLAAVRARRATGLPTLLTPHMGEAARLATPFGISTDDAARLALELARAYGAVVALKGPVTWVSDGDETACMDEGTPALAKAGTGDVLAGMAGALLAQGVPAFSAAYLAATLHALAGRSAADRLTDVCVVPEDVVEAIPEAIRMLEARRA